MAVMTSVKKSGSRGAIEIARHGGPDVLRYTRLEDPVPRGAEVVVEVEAVGMNYRDVYERQGAGIYAGDVPRVIGVEGAGTVAQTGERVAWVAVPGSYAERIVASAESLVSVPDGVSLKVACAVLLQGMTAHYLAYDSFPIKDGDWVLVHAAAGGVGRLLAQLANLRGGRVIGTTSSEAKAGLALSAGAEEVIGYDRFGDRVREITGGDGVAVVYDGVGKATFLEGLKALRPTGTMVLYGAASGPPEPMEMLLLATLGSLYVQRPTLNTYTARPEQLRERAAAVFTLVAEGALEVRIGRRYPLARAREAHEELESRATTGKLLLVPGE
jgi:NADPH2:quinone reductase